MSITWCHEALDSEPLKLDVKPGSQSLEIVRKFEILTTTYDDSSITVCSCNDLPTPFSFYSKGNDYNANLVATKCTASRDKKQPLLWRVTVGYTQAVNFIQGGPSGDQDITCFQPSVRNWKIAEEKTVWKGRLQLPAHGATPAETYADTMAKAVEPIVNSVNKLYADGISVVRNIRGWEISRYEWQFNETQADDYTDVVNADTCWLHAPGTVKMVAITGERQTVNNEQVWRVTYEFHICDPGGWGEEILDNGMELWIKDDGSVPATPAEATKSAVIKDGQGNPISSPELLDGAGYWSGVSAVLDPDADPVIVTWHYLEEATFGNIRPILPSLQSLNIISGS